MAPDTIVHRLTLAGSCATAGMRRMGLAAGPRTASSAASSDGAAYQLPSVRHRVHRRTGVAVTVRSTRAVLSACRRALGAYQETAAPAPLRLGTRRAPDPTTHSGPRGTTLPAPAHLPLKTAAETLHRTTRVPPGAWSTREATGWSTTSRTGSRPRATPTAFIVTLKLGTPPSL